MKRIIIAVVAVCSAVFGLTSVTTVPAHAYACIAHTSPDDGYDPLFYVRWNGYDSWIYEGEAKCNVSMIYVNAGARILCSSYGPGGPYGVKWDATGWHGVAASFGGYCVYQLD